MKPASAALLDRLSKDLLGGHSRRYRQRYQSDLVIANQGDGLFTLQEEVDGSGELFLVPRMSFWLDNGTWTPLDYRNDVSGKQHKAAVVLNGAELVIADHEAMDACTSIFDEWAANILFLYFDEEED